MTTLLFSHKQAIFLATMLMRLSSYTGYHLVYITHTHTHRGIVFVFMHLKQKRCFNFPSQELLRLSFVNTSTTQLRDCCCQFFTASFPMFHISSLSIFLFNAIFLENLKALKGTGVNNIFTRFAISIFIISKWNVEMQFAESHLRGNLDMLSQCHKKNKNHKHTQ